MSAVPDIASRLHDVECHVSTTHELVDAASMAAKAITDEKQRNAISALLWTMDNRLDELALDLERLREAHATEAGNAA
ncbi:MAG: hypothetical protein J0J10_17970 [Bosea sp.]|uniref:hypothetical protein n=1 Tax=Bosea sp. (in: a-proteobacteria) TaxID=1871050 RepID=UPI001AC37BCA|nr:hypothetical protein [Bosea sp. (in: a-proteobacteria)]MBN9470656.1 hypothetical protein [Bosea sp. (in: a-proteobacteria)]